MPRSVNHVASRAKRKRILKLTRGYYGARKNVWTVAKNTWEKGLTYAFRDRRNKKRNFRALWIQRINAGARIEGLSYSRLMGALRNAGIEINRKVLADLAMNHPEAFKAIIDKGKVDFHIIRNIERAVSKMQLSFVFSYQIFGYLKCSIYLCSKGIEIKS
jgi:large subunit ribosomal protein L20